MNSLRALCIAGSIVLGASIGYSDDLLKKNHGGGGSPPSQGGGSKNDSKPSGSSNSSGNSQRDSGPRRDNGSSSRDNGSRQDSRSGSRDSGSRDSRSDRTGTRNDGSRPREDNRPRGGSIDDFLRNQRGGGSQQGGSNVKPGNGGQYQPKPAERNNPRPGGSGDDLFRPGRRGGGSNDSPRGDGRPIYNDPRGGSGSQGGSNTPPRGGGDSRPIYDGPRGGGSGGQLGRIDNPQGSRPTSRPGTDGFLGRKGGNSYGGQVNNLNRDTRSMRPVQINRAPIDIFRGGLQHQVRREDNIRISSRNCRVGYYHYYNNWCDDNFWFNFYVFDPFVSNCYVSPWYYYPHLPGYLSPRCCHVINISLDPWYGTYYNWRQPSGYDYNDASPLDYAVDDIRNMFDRVDARSLRRLLPYNDRIAIFVDGEYSYSMDPEDFESFMLDNIENTRTIRYEITRVERKGREAQVEAKHEYEDTWGRTTTVYHSYRLELDRGNYVITRFGTSYSRN